MFNAGAAIARLNLDDSDYRRGMREAGSLARGFQTEFTSMGRGLDKTTGSMTAMGRSGAAGMALVSAGAAAATAAAASTANLFGRGLKLAIDYEQLETGLEVMLGSADEAKRVLKDLSDFAERTPFRLDALGDATRTLVGARVATSELLPTLQMLGDAASGMNVPIETTAQLYAKAKRNVTLYMDDVQQLADRGFPIMEELAKQFGVSESEVRKLVESGRVGFPNLERAMRSVTGAGGLFHNMMDKQSKSLGGMLGTLQDAMDTANRKLGEGFAKGLRLGDVTGGATQFFKDLEKIAFDAGEAIGDAIGPYLKDLVDWAKENPHKIRAGVDLVVDGIVFGFHAATASLQTFLKTADAVLGFISLFNDEAKKLREELRAIKPPEGLDAMKRDLAELRKAAGGTGGGSVTPLTVPMQQPVVVPRYDPATAPGAEFRDVSVSVNLDVDAASTKIAQAVAGKVRDALGNVDGKFKQMAAQASAEAVRSSLNIA